MAVAYGLHRFQLRVIPHGQQFLYFGEQPLFRHGPDPLLNAFIKFLAGPGQPDLERVIRGDFPVLFCQVPGPRDAAGIIYFQGPEQPLAVVGMDARGGSRVDFCKFTVQNIVPLSLQSFAEFLLQGFILFLASAAVIFCAKSIFIKNPFEQTPEIKPGAAGQKRNVAMALYNPDGFPGICYKAAKGVVVIRVNNIDQVMGNAVSFLRGRLGSAYIHVPVDLHGINAHYLAGKVFGNLQGEFGLADSCRTAEDEELLFR